MPRKAGLDWRKKKDTHSISDTYHCRWSRGGALVRSPSKRGAFNRERIEFRRSPFYSSMGIETTTSRIRGQGRRACRESRRQQNRGRGRTRRSTLTPRAGSENGALITVDGHTHAHTKRFLRPTVTHQQHETHAPLCLSNLKLLVSQKTYMIQTSEAQKEFLNPTPTQERRDEGPNLAT